jgi:hypothetical protein
MTTMRPLIVRLYPNGEYYEGEGFKSTKLDDLAGQLRRWGHSGSQMLLIENAVTGEKIMSATIADLDGKTGRTRIGGNWMST